MKDKNGKEIKVGVKIKHVGHHSVVTVQERDGVLFGGQIRIDAYHESVLEVVECR
ncbi:hypothetical protein [Vibrio casei]|uniref:hypothetical protein n=1 Tax=Vibrio casei TaxID=673372 RepID=UPI003F977C82